MTQEASNATDYRGAEVEVAVGLDSGNTKTWRNINQANKCKGKESVLGILSG